MGCLDGVARSSRAASTVRAQALSFDTFNPTVNYVLTGINQATDRGYALSGCGFRLIQAVFSLRVRSGERQMPVVVDVSELPAPLALILQPWGGVLETAPVGMGESVRTVAANASASLWRRVVMMPPIEQGLARALSASAELAVELNGGRASQASIRNQALAAFDTLIALLREARPNARAKGLGLGW